MCAAGGSACPQARPRRSWPARGQAKQRKVRVSGTELCPRLRKHILAEERNTIQAGREAQLPSNPLQEALGSLQLLESYYQLLGSLLLQAFVCLFSVFCTSVLQRGKNGVRREGRARAGGQAARLPFPARHYLIVWPWGMSPCHFPLCPAPRATGWFHPTKHSLLVYSSLSLQNALEESWGKLCPARAGTDPSLRAAAKSEAMEPSPSPLAPAAPRALKRFPRQTLPVLPSKHSSREGKRGSHCLRDGR